ncbi:unnamed protein product [Cuscuta epithymum]|uniref:Protein kinase domain-containing protein n=1 Tax=Cuscuta epithymum TaxID=186058 RepID=A0AAV0D7K3_9ASTE|nr:unnamed protein product [Cuscuta epithymum]
MMKKHPTLLRKNTAKNHIFPQLFPVTRSKMIFRKFFFFSFLFIFFSFSTHTTADLATDRAALVALRHAVGGRSLIWNLSDPNTCSWAGIKCSTDNNSVVELRLPGSGLSGSIPPATISNITGLQTLSLRYNALSGPLPSDLFTSLRDLRRVYLHRNFFSGRIPESVFSIPNLVHLNLAHNNFSGSLSPSVSNLTRLTTLYLQENQLSGSIPELDLPGLAQFNVSDNQFTGEIPGKLSGQPRSAFQGNSLCGRPLDLCGWQRGRKKRLSGGAIGGIVAGSVIGLVLLLLLLILLFPRGKRGGRVEQGKQNEEAREEKSAAAAAFGGKEKEKGKQLVFLGGEGGKFGLDELLKASAEVLGKGSLGTAYKAVLEKGVRVVVKRLREVGVAEEEFRERMEGVGKMRGENLLPLTAYFYSGDEKLLVYDYMPMGSLSALLHGNKGGGRTPLNWETRASIALSTARGITYIHSQGPYISHGNIKSSNVLLTKSYDARVSDFGLSQLIGPTSTPNRIGGYKAPEVTDPRKVTQEGDVYSFGVLLLELLTGKAPTHSLTSEEGFDLPRWVESIIREEWTAEVFDPELLRYQNVEEDMVKLLQLAVDCTAQYPDKRPSMAVVTSRIQGLISSSVLASRDGIIDDLNN